VIFTPLPLPGAFLIEPELRADDRGFFARAWCAAEFAAHGLDARFVQSSISFNHRRGTLRGLHYQAPPHEEVKLVRCAQGAAWDVIVDLRPDSPTFQRWYACELSADNRLAVYVPKGFAHGFQTRQDNTELLYAITTPFEPSAARGVRWNDPSLKISWPIVPPQVISRRDEELPFLPA
jgi:dTDP-4-dehydrorhamnose 3,5-epimerase